MGKNPQLLKTNCNWWCFKKNAYQFNVVFLLLTNWCPFWVVLL